MTEPPSPPLEDLLRQIAAAEPQPWYPTAYAPKPGPDCDHLDAFLEQLRLAGLIRLTDWEKGLGQGYALTPEGQARLGPPPTEPTESRRDAEVQAAWENRGAPRLTLLLLTLNLGWFAVGALLARRAGLPTEAYLNGDVPKILHALGSVSGPDLLHGGGWRLVACCFVHHDWSHLAGNMIALVLLGPMAEQLWGRWRFLTVYLLSGLGGSVTAMAVDPSVQLIGASGALFGMMASAIVWIVLNRAHLPQFQAGGAARALLAVILLILVGAGVFERPGQHISHSAHLGGAATGAAVAALLNWLRYGGRRIGRGIALAGLVLLTPALLLGLGLTIRWAPRWVELRIQLAEQEEQARYHAACFPLLRASDNLRTEVLQAVLKTLRTPPPTAADRKQLANALAEQRRLEDEFGNVPPFQTGPFRALFEAGQKLLAARTALFDLIVRRMRCPIWLPQLDAEFRDQRASAADALKRYNELAGRR